MYWPNSKCFAYPGSGVFEWTNNQESLQQKNSLSNQVKIALIH